MTDTVGKPNPQERISRTWIHFNWKVVQEECQILAFQMGTDPSAHTHGAGRLLLLFLCPEAILGVKALKDRIPLIPFINKIVLCSQVGMAGQPSQDGSLGVLPG